MNCYRILRTATRPLRHHLRKHIWFHAAAVASVGCVAGPGALVLLLPPSTSQAVTPAVSIPEPATWLVLGFAAMSLVVLRLYRSRP